MLIDLRKPHPTTNPGEAAYLAYWRGMHTPLALPWDRLDPEERRAWRTVARTLARWEGRPRWGRTRRMPDTVAVTFQMPSGNGCAGHARRGSAGGCSSAGTWRGRDTRPGGIC